MPDLGGMTDSSGVTLHYTPNLREQDIGFEKKKKKHNHILCVCVCLF